MFFHKHERVILDVAEVLDTGPRPRSGPAKQRGDDHNSLDAPVVSVLLQQLMVIEESRVEPTHVAI